MKSVSKILFVMAIGLALATGCEKKGQELPAPKEPEETAPAEKTPDAGKKQSEAPAPAPTKEADVTAPVDAVKPDDAAPMKREDAPVDNPQQDAPAPAVEAAADEGMTPEQMDKEIDTEYRDKLKADHPLMDCKVKGKAKDGVLTLTGQAPTKELKAKAEELAKTVAGVKSIKNNIEMGGKEIEARKLTDADLKTELKEKLAADSQLKHATCTVDVKEGKATITGTVANDDMKKKVDVLAKTVRGLAAVDNQIKVQPAGKEAPKTPKMGDNANTPEAPAAAQPAAMPDKPEPRGDAAMANELRAKTLADSQLSYWDISVNVTNGAMTLTGTVPTEELKKKANVLAKTVSGTKSITDNLQVTNEPVTPVEKRGDTAIKIELKEKLLADSELSAWKTTVDVHNGVVTLNGSVDTEQAKKKATELTQTVFGVKDIRNDLMVKGADAEKTTDMSAPNNLSKKIENSLMADPKMKGSEIHVEVDSKGVATLSGNVRSEEQKQMAEKTAKETEGVTSVRNKLEVKPEGTK